MNKENDQSKTLNTNKLLRDQVIDKNKPGTILLDFNILLDYVESNVIKVSKTNNLLPINLLADLNEKLTKPIKINLKRPLQNAYPYITGLYLLLRSMSIAYISDVGKAKHLVLDEAILHSWNKLNPVEQYFTLLECWLYKGNPEILGESNYGWHGIPMNVWPMFFKKIPKQGLNIAGNKGNEESLKYTPGLFTTAILDMFGLITVEHADPDPGKGMKIAKIHRTSFGDELLKLMEIVVEDDFYFYDKFDNSAELEFGELQAAIQPLFPEWQNKLIIQKPEFKDGTYVFKVSLYDAWRRIAINGKDDFDILSDCILDAFEFDNDHLYQFKYKNRFNVNAALNHPEDEPPYADEALIGDIGLQPGSRLIYLFDFGASWKFIVDLERIDEVDQKIQNGTILESHGDAPDQYPDYYF